MEIIWLIQPSAQASHIAQFYISNQPLALIYIAYYAIKIISFSNELAHSRGDLVSLAASHEQAKSLNRLLHLNKYNVQVDDA